jgi:hypothetical protein
MTDLESMTIIAQTAARDAARALRQVDELTSRVESLESLRLSEMEHDRQAGEWQRFAERYPAASRVRINGVVTPEEMSDRLVATSRKRDEARAQCDRFAAEVQRERIENEELTAQMVLVTAEADRMRAILKHIAIHGGTTKLYGGDIPEYVRKRMQPPAPDDQP